MTKPKGSENVRHVPCPRCGKPTLGYDARCSQYMCYSFGCHWSGLEPPVATKTADDRGQEYETDDACISSPKRCPKCRIIAEECDCFPDPKPGTPVAFKPGGSAECGLAPPPEQTSTPKEPDMQLCCPKCRKPIRGWFETIPPRPNCPDCKWTGESDDDCLKLPEQPASPAAKGDDESSSQRQYLSMRDQYDRFRTRAEKEIAELIAERDGILVRSDAAVKKLIAERDEDRTADAERDAAVERLIADAYYLSSHAWLERFRKASYANNYWQISPDGCKQIASHIDAFIAKVNALAAVKATGKEKE